MSRRQALASAKPAGRRLAATLRRHWLFAALLAGGGALRAVTLFAYTPALFGVTDSYSYLSQSEDLEPGQIRPIGYSVFLRLLPLGWGLEVVTVAQHVLGLVVATLLYAVLVRVGVPRWLAALGSLPALLDAYVLNIEHHVLGETLFHLLIVSTCAALLWRRPLGIPFAAAGGVLLAAATLTRPVGLFLVAPAALAALWLAASPARRRALAGLALVAAFALPLAGYGLWFRSVHGEFALSSESGRYLYGRVAPIAECEQFTVPDMERGLCPTAPIGQRRNDYEFMWSSNSPVAQLEPPAGMSKADLAGSFAGRVIRNQPLDYLRLVASDVLRDFAATKETGSRGYRVDPWQFQEGFPIFYQGLHCPPPPGASEDYASGCGRRTASTEQVIAAYGGSGGESVEGLSSMLRVYQRFGYVPGPLLLAGLVGALAVAGAGMSRSRRSQFSAPAFLFAGSALTLAVGSAALSSFSWRYQLPQLFLLPPAAALAAAAFVEHRRARAAETAPRPREARL
jgi:hypothetical protein